MSYVDPPPTPTPSEPPAKSLFEFDSEKWEQQQVAENGGIERTSLASVSSRKNR